VAETTWRAEASIGRRCTEMASTTAMEQGPNPFDLASVAEAESILADLAAVFFQTSAPTAKSPHQSGGPNMEARYKVLLDQIPAVVFMAFTCSPTPDCV
jgi:hypothetical protein